MLIEDILWLILSAIIVRAVWRMVDRAMQGAGARMSAGTAARETRGGVPAQGVQMARDPVCGVFVIPDRALSLSDRSGQVFFCSDACRDKYRAKSA